MISLSLRNAYYALAGPLMWVNGYLYRFFRAPKEGTGKVHLGPGRQNYLDGWINVDANVISAKIDVWADLRNPLPFSNDSVTAFYSHHVIEHLPDVRAHLREVHRCLRPGGVYRVGVPSFDSAIARFLAGDSAWFGEWPERRRSMGGRLESFVFCRGEHLTALTRCYLQELLEDAGFCDISEQGPITKSGYAELFKEAMATEWESHFDAPHTLIFECRKPAP